MQGGIVLAWKDYQGNFIMNLVKKSITRDQRASHLKTKKVDIKYKSLESSISYELFIKFKCKLIVKKQWDEKDFISVKLNEPTKQFPEIKGKKLIRWVIIPVKTLSIQPENIAKPSEISVQKTWLIQSWLRVIIMDRVIVPEKAQGEKKELELKKCLQLNP